MHEHCYAMSFAPLVLQLSSVTISVRVFAFCMSSFCFASQTLYPANIDLDNRLCFYLVISAISMLYNTCAKVNAVMGSNTAASCQPAAAHV